MRAFTLTSLDESASLRDDLPAPVPGAGGVRVRVQASSVNPVDAAIVAGMLSGMFEHTFPVVLGRDYAGVVEDVGTGVTRYRPGDEVYGYVPHAGPGVHDGSWAELLVAPEHEFIAPRPRNVGVAEAGAAALAGITAMLAIDALEIADSHTLLVVGATGGVGSFAVQLAAQAGATVIAPALPEDEAYLRSLGVSELVDRRADVPAAIGERFAGGVDALLDVVSYAPDGFNANAAALKPGGRGASPNSAAGEGSGRSNIMAAATPQNLQRLAGLLEAGALKVPIQDSFRLDQAGEALSALGTTHTRGKLALEIG